MFTDYTTADSVRAVLGISVKEVSDQKVTDTIYLTGLLEALHQLNPAISAAFLTARAVSQRSAKQTRFVLLVETYCAYVVAIQMIPNLPLSAPQVITDGKTAINRIANPYEHLLPDLTASLITFGQRLLNAYADLTPGYTAPTRVTRKMVTSTGTAFDNVTGV